MGINFCREKYTGEAFDDRWPSFGRLIDAPKSRREIHMGVPGRKSTEFRWMTTTPFATNEILLNHTPP